MFSLRGSRRGWCGDDGDAVGRRKKPSEEREARRNRFCVVIRQKKEHGDAADCGRDAPTTRSVCPNIFMPIAIIHLPVGGWTGAAAAGPDHCPRRRRRHELLGHVPHVAEAWRDHASFT